MNAISWFRKRSIEITQRIKRKARKESKAKRIAEEKAPKAMCGVHTRFREMKPCDDEDSDISIEDFSAEGDSLNYCASPSSSFS